MPHFALDTRDFKRVARLAYDRFGLDMPESKQGMVQNRLTKLAREFGVDSLKELLDHIERSKSPEDLLSLFDVLSTNLTSFYRETVHFELLKQHVVGPALEESQRGGPRKLRMWSAGCSNGCEPYTIGMALVDSLPGIESWDVRVLATDLAETEINLAKSATYPSKVLEGVPQDAVRTYFRVGNRNGRPVYQVVDEVRRLVTFGLLNLMAPWPMKGPFDAIFCRNVMIYFDLETREKLVKRYTKLLRPGGLLCIGSSENLAGSHAELRRVGPSAFVKKGRGET